MFKQPTIVYNYPKDIKAFYMKLNEDGKTVAAMDVLVPGVGELIGGSQREDSLESLKARIVEQPGIGEEGLDAYEGTQLCFHKIVLQKVVCRYVPLL